MLDNSALFRNNSYTAHVMPNDVSLMNVYTEKKHNTYTVIKIGQEIMNYMYIVKYIGWLGFSTKAREKSSLSYYT